MLLPLVPLRDVVIFPGVVTPLFVGRDKSINALQKSMSDDKSVMLVAQKNPNDEDPSLNDLYTIGTVSTILQLIKLPDGTYKVLVEGIKRASIINTKKIDFFMKEFLEFLAISNTSTINPSHFHHNSTIIPPSNYFCLSL